VEANEGHRKDILSVEEREEIRKLRRENFELRRANEILKSARAISMRQRNAVSRVAAGVWKPSVSRGRVLSL
jgi:transposase-like protein